MPIGVVLLAASLGAFVPDGVAAPREVALDPPGAEVAFRAYGLGLLPLDGTFNRFHGVLTYDPRDHAACQVRLTVTVASLSMGDPSVRDIVLGPDFMDAARYPSLVFAGGCQPGGLGGMLGLHGVTAPFRLTLAWSGDRVVAEGRLQRADWGMTARPLLGGRTVRIRVSVPLR